MANDKHGLKDKIAGKTKKLEGKLTNDHTREMQGKIQELKGKAQDKAADLRDDLKHKDSQED